VSKDKATRRCAVYTRKSSEEGLEQDFNSLDAQRAACEAYIASQIGEGWRLIKAAYDDGGYSGGSMERPALKHLLADIDAGKIDIVVVYKVDRLTRSLIDFGRMVERFDAKGVSFVSVTQAFSTANSMGRLTLNMLLSFAQYEREITGERIRDKIAASKQRGLWMGGRPMLGYKPAGRTLEIEPTEAPIVIHIFQRYLALGSVHALRDELERDGIRSKSWTTKSGAKAGGGVIERGALYHILRNRHYLGEIMHKGQSYRGQHPAIVPPDLLEAVAARLAQNAVARREAPLRPGGSPLARLLFDHAGHRMSPSHARGKSGAPHRYYVSRPALAGKANNGVAIQRAPARELEAVVAARLTRLMDAPLDWAVARRALRRIDLTTNGVALSFDRQSLEPSWLERLRDEEGFCERECTLQFEARFAPRSGAVRMLDAHGRSVTQAPEVNAALVRALARGWRWRALLLRGVHRSSAALARSEGVTRKVVRRSLALAYLAPDLQREILDGRQRPGHSLDRLSALDIPRDWAAQRRLLAQTFTP
jgi:site-specific DNA recombinase